MDRTKLLLVAACLALAGVVVWQQSSDVAMVVPPRPLQLTSTPAPTVNAAPPPVAAPTNESAVERPTNTASAPAIKPVSRREDRSNTPATIASRSNVVATPLAPAVVKESTAAATPEESGSSEAHEAAAVRRFTLIHDHSRGNFEKDPKASCVGELTVSPTEIKFDGAGAGEGHHFEASWAEVLDAGSNKFFGSGIGGFHLTITENGKYQNLNFAPKSKDKAEAKLIIDLLNANARKADRGK